MKKLIAAFIILLIAIMAGYFIQKDAGYILITYNHWMVATSFWVGIACVLLSFLIFYWLIRAFKNLFLIPKKISIRKKNNRTRKNYRLLKKSLFDLFTGRYRQAEKTFQNIARHSKKPTLFYLLSAISAQKEKRIDTRDKQIQLAYQGSQSDMLAIRLVHARLYLDNHQYEEALSLLRNIHKTHSKNKVALELLTVCYQSLADWGSLIDLLPTVTKLGALPHQAITALESTAFCAHLKQQAKLNNLKAFEKTWERAPETLTKQSALILLYVQLLDQNKNFAKKNQFIEATLKKQWVPELLSFFNTHKKTTKTQSYTIKVAESWLKKHYDSPELNYTLARICLQENLYGKAREYAIKANTLHKTPATLALLGKILINLDEEAQAEDYFKQSALATLSETR